MNLLGSCLLRISKDSIDFNKLSKSLKIKPTKVIKKGQSLSKVGNRIANHDSWHYEIEIIDKIKPQDVLHEMINLLLPIQKSIEELVNTHEVYLALYLRSDYGQFGFELSRNVIKKLSELGLDLDFHILSFGGVE